MEKKRQKKVAVEEGGELVRLLGQASLPSFPFYMELHSSKRKTENGSYLLVTQTVSI